jgi:hypothetical protein
MVHPLVKSKDKKEQREGIVHQVTSLGDEGVIDLFIELFDRLEALEKKSSK